MGSNRSYGVNKNIYANSHNGSMKELKIQKWIRKKPKFLKNC